MASAKKRGGGRKRKRVSQESDYSATQLAERMLTLEARMEQIKEEEDCDAGCTLKPEIDATQRAMLDCDCCACCQLDRPSWGALQLLRERWNGKLCGFCKLERGKQKRRELAEKKLGDQLLFPTPGDALERKTAREVGQKSLILRACGHIERTIALAPNDITRDELKHLRGCLSSYKSKAGPGQGRGHRPNREKSQKGQASLFAEVGQMVRTRQRLSVEPDFRDLYVSLGMCLVKLKFM